MDKYTTSTAEGVPGETVTQVDIAYLELILYSSTIFLAFSNILLTISRPSLSSWK